MKIVENLKEYTKINWEDKNMKIRQQNIRIELKKLQWNLQIRKV